MNIVDHDHPLAATPANAPTSAKVPSPRLMNSVLRCCWSCVSTSPGFLGNVVCVGISVLRRCESFASMSTSKRSGMPSPFTSATSTPIDELLICRCAVQAASRKPPCLSFRKN